MLNCDYAVCFQIFDDWNLFKLITGEFLTAFCTWDSNAHLMLIYQGILLFSPHLVKNKPWIHFKSFIFSFLKEGSWLLFLEFLWKMFIQHNKVHFVRNLFSQILILDKDIPDLLGFFFWVMTSKFDRLKNTTIYTCQLFSHDTQLFHKECVFQSLKLSEKYF